MRDNFSKVIGLVITFVIVGFTIFWFSYDIEWSEDDLFYMFNYATGLRISSVSDIIQSQVSHWFGHNGRFCVHLLVQAFVGLSNHLVFAVFNSIITLLFIVALIKVSGGRVLNMKQLLLGTVTLLFFCDTHYTPPCQINYIWSGLFNLVFLLILFNKDSKILSNRFVLPFLFVFALFTGNSNEAIGIGLGAALCIFALTNFKSLSTRQIILLAGYAIGLVLLCVAPSNFNRVNSNVSIFYSVYYFLKHARIFYILILYLIYDTLINKKNIKDIYMQNSIYFNAIFILLIFNFVIHIINNRQIFGIELFSAVIFLKLVYKNNINAWLLSLCVVAIGFIYTIKWQNINKFNHAYSYFMSEMKSGKDVIYLDTPIFNEFVEPTSPFHRIADWHIVCAKSFINGHLELDSCDVLIMPKIMETVDNGPVSNKFYKLDNGFYIILQDKNHPADFTIDRYINIFGLKFKYKPYHLEFDKNSVYNTDKYNVIVSDFKTPLIEYADVKIYE